jgi:hypothetical protein
VHTRAPWAASVENCVEAAGTSARRDHHGEQPRAYMSPDHSTDLRHDQLPQRGHACLEPRRQRSGSGRVVEMVHGHVHAGPSGPLEGEVLEPRDGTRGRPDLLQRLDLPLVQMQ